MRTVRHRIQSPRRIGREFEKLRSVCFAVPSRLAVSDTDGPSAGERASVFWVLRLRGDAGFATLVTPPSRQCAPTPRPTVSHLGEKAMRTKDLDSRLFLPSGDKV